MTELTSFIFLQYQSRNGIYYKASNRFVIHLYPTLVGAENDGIEIGIVLRCQLTYQCIELHLILPLTGIRYCVVRSRRCAWSSRKYLGVSKTVWEWR